MSCASDIYLLSLFTHPGDVGAPRNSFYQSSGSINLIIVRAFCTRASKSPYQPSDGGASDGGAGVSGAAGASGAGSEEAAAGGGAPAPFFFPIASITRARDEPGSFRTRTHRGSG